MPDPVLTSLRKAIAEKVESITGVKIIPGYFDGPLETAAKLGCCYSIGASERPGNVAQQTMEVRVRIFLHSSGLPADPSQPLDPSELERYAQMCQEQISAGDQAIGGTWQARLTEYEINMEQFGVEMAFLAWDWNQFALVGPLD